MRSWVLSYLAQIRCFDAPLQPQALQDVKVIVARNTTLGVCNDGLTLEGVRVCVCVCVCVCMCVCVCVCVLLFIDLDVRLFSGVF